MKRFIFAGCLFFIFGCASQSSAPAPQAQGVPLPANAESSPPEPSSDSQVLSGKKKCPKHTQYVNGKCTLEVESDE